MSDSNAVIETIIKIFSTPFVLDAIIIIFLLFSFIIGIRRKGWRAIWRFIFVVILLIGLGLFALKPMANWLASDKFFNAINFHPKFDYGGEEPIDLTSITHLIYVLGRLSTNRDLYTLAYSKELAFGLCRAISWFGIVLFVHLISWVFSALLWLLVRRVIPKRVRFKKPMPFLGGIIGLLQGVILISSYMVATGAITPGFAYIYESGKAGLFGLDDSIVGIVSILNPKNSSLFGAFSLEGHVFSFNVEDGEDIYFTSGEFVAFGEALISGELDEGTIEEIIEQFEEECYVDGNFVCTI